MPPLPTKEHFSCQVAAEEELVITIGNNAVLLA